MEFTELEKTKTCHKYVLESNLETMKMFPFKFDLYVTYEVEENRVITIYEVINKDEKEMLFGIGGHPAYICDYSSGNYSIEFEDKEDSIKFFSLDNGLVIDKETKNLLENNSIYLNKNSFVNDAIIIKNIKSNKVFLKEKNRKILEFDFTGFPYLGIWAKIGAPFVCIEPWMNTADKVSSDGNFSNKEDILKLKPDEKFKCSYSVKFL